MMSRAATRQSRYSASNTAEDPIPRIKKRIPLAFIQPGFVRFFTRQTVRKSLTTVERVVGIPIYKKRLEFAPQLAPPPAGGMSVSLRNASAHPVSVPQKVSLRGSAIPKAPLRSALDFETSPPVEHPADVL